MLLPCEVAVKCLLPSVRATLAKTLTTKHKLTQTEAAKILGMSQPAISLYDRKMRGRALELEDDKEIIHLVENLAEALTTSDLPHRDFMQAFCEICKTTRAKGMLCQMHKTFDATVDVEKCQLCFAADRLTCT